MKYRTKRIEIRLTETEYAQIKSHSVNHSSIGQYIRAAIKEYSDVDAKQRLQLIEQLGHFYRESRNDLSHIGGNLNQSVMRANELAKSGALNSKYIADSLMPEIEITQKVLSGIYQQLLSLTQKATSL